MPIPLGILAVAGAGGGASGAFELISTTLITTNTASVTFSAIPTTFQHLQIRATMRSSRASGEDPMGLRFNGVTTQSYARHDFTGTGGTPSSSGQINQTFIRLDAVSDGGQTASSFDSMVLDILDYKSTAKNKTIRSLKGKTGTQVRLSLESGVFLDTSAISSISFSFPLTSENFISGSRFSLYGIRG